MKKIILAVSMTLLLILTGCGIPQDDGEPIVKDKDFLLNGYGKTGAIEVLTDTKTGCRYLVYDRGISPFYGEDGKVQGCGMVTINTVDTNK